MRGEYVETGQTEKFHAGSSPHAWGIHPAPHRARRGPRFIPTCVGNTSRAASAARAEAVHPHMRGEYLLIHVTQAKRPGSSPHAWGIPLSQQGEAWRDRFIPTCVGNTGSAVKQRSRLAVHPHMRGEYFLWTRSPQPCDGSSPHAWGILPPPAVSVPRQRFIPTCVGNTPGYAAKGRSRAVHPHMRGEYV